MRVRLKLNKVELLFDNVLRFTWRRVGGLYDGTHRWENLDLTILLRNLAVAGALHQAYVTGRCDGIVDGQFLASRYGAP